MDRVVGRDGCVRTAISFGDTEAFAILTISIALLGLVGNLFLQAPGNARGKLRLVPRYYYGLAALVSAVTSYYADIRGIALVLWTVLIFGIATFNVSVSRVCWGCGRVTFVGIRRPKTFCGGCGATLEKLRGSKRT